MNYLLTIPKRITRTVSYLFIVGAIVIDEWLLPSVEIDKAPWTALEDLPE